MRAGLGSGQSGRCFDSWWWVPAKRVRARQPQIRARETQVCRPRAVPGAGAHRMETELGAAAALRASHRETWAPGSQPLQSHPGLSIRIGLGLCLLPPQQDPGIPHTP